LFDFNVKKSFIQKLFIIKKINKISNSVSCPHSQKEILFFIREIISIPKEKKGCIVEAGAFKGGSTAKFSIAAKIAKRELVVFDSFKGIPENDGIENQGIDKLVTLSKGRCQRWTQNSMKKDIKENKEIKLYQFNFPKGLYAGSLKEVKENVKKFGEINSCRFIKGWFKDSMPKFSTPIVAVYLDVDLASSTKTCLKHLYPLIVPGGVLYSQDAHIPAVVDLFNDNKFWRKELGIKKPKIEKPDTSLIKIVKH